jgi:ElaB/YqjD/DUF883 family membrane-anchored ribosome-binding protein
MTTKDTAGAFNSGTDYAADIAKSGIDHASSAIKDAARQSGHLADEALDGVQHTYQNAKDAARRDFGEIERQIRENPVQTALIAIGVGFLIGRLATR